MRITVWLFGREVICVETGPTDERPELEGAPGGDFQFGFSVPEYRDEHGRVVVSTPVKE